jgi:cell division protein FtsL
MQPYLFIIYQHHRHDTMEKTLAAETAAASQAGLLEVGRTEAESKSIRRKKRRQAIKRDVSFLTKAFIAIMIALVTVFVVVTCILVYIWNASVNDDITKTRHAGHEASAMIANITQCLIDAAICPW